MLQRFTSPGQLPEQAYYFQLEEELPWEPTTTLAPLTDSELDRLFLLEEPAGDSQDLRQIGRFPEENWVAELEADPLALPAPKPTGDSLGECERCGKEGVLYPTGDMDVCWECENFFYSPTEQ
jgi:hypothetical protein